MSAAIFEEIEKHSTTVGCIYVLRADEPNNLCCDETGYAYAYMHGAYRFGGQASSNREGDFPELASYSTANANGKTRDDMADFVRKALGVSGRSIYISVVACGCGQVAGYMPRYLFEINSALRMTRQSRIVSNRLLCKTSMVLNA